MFTRTRIMAGAATVAAGAILSSIVVAGTAEAATEMEQCLYRTNNSAIVYANADLNSARVGYTPNGNYFYSDRNATQGAYGVYFLPYHNVAGDGWVVDTMATMQSCG